MNNRTKGNKIFPGKDIKTQKYGRKAKLIYKMIRKLHEIEEENQIFIQIDSLKTTLRKIPNWKTPGYNDIHCLWF